MRYLLLTLVLLLPSLSFSQEEIKYKTYSYSEFFQMIEDEEDSVFSLSDAIIKVNPITDTLHFVHREERIVNDGRGFLEELNDRDSIYVNKAIRLNNVQFLSFDYVNNEGQASSITASIYKVSFLEHVEIINSFSAVLHRSTFHKGLSMTNYLKSKEVYAAYKPYEAVSAVNGDRLFNNDIFIESCLVKENIQILYNYEATENRSARIFWIVRSRLPKVDIEEELAFGNLKLMVYENSFERLSLYTDNLDGSIEKNRIKGITGFRFLENTNLTILDNSFEDFVVLDQDELNVNVDWSQWYEKYIPIEHINFIEFKLDEKDHNRGVFRTMFDKSNILIFQDSIRASNKRAYTLLTQELAGFYNNFKKNHETENANLVYREIKNLETQRLAYLYKTDPTFDRYFTWKINQFLKIFSAYGTKPSRAIIFSVYVILAFALVYLFFPNYWDSHGKSRIMDRYRFFTKYMKQDSGMHEVYLEEKNHELMASEDFRNYMLESEKGVPKFFMATALPLYRWSVAGTRTFSWMLSKADVLKGKWSETEDSKKGGKSFLLITAFIIALLYDLFIKVLNALMLSINTFTTLGFGEIPIKGLPRYLAIIQGFIGWFMLTIFSVSLISQLLN